MERLMKISMSEREVQSISYTVVDPQVETLKRELERLLEENRGLIGNVRSAPQEGFIVDNFPQRQTTFGRTSGIIPSTGRIISRR